MIKIMIIGGGFGGIRCALDLDKKLRGIDSEITLIDRNGYHLFVPALYEVASAYGIKKDSFFVRLKKTVCLPYNDIFDRKNINFIQAEISGADLNRREIMTGGGHIFGYDYLVLALGAESSDFNIAGVKEYAYKFKTLEDSLMINKRLEEFSEQFAGGNRTEPLDFLICGGGFTGVELAAELGCCSRVIEKKCKMKNRCSRISLFEAGPKILPALPENERRIAKNRLTDLGVAVVENSQIEEIGSGGIKLKSGQKIRGDMIVWSGGIRPSGLIAGINGLEKSESGKIKVDEFLRAIGSENIFAIGDSAEFIDPAAQKPVPALAYVSLDQGKAAAKNIFASIKKRKLKAYKPFYGLWIIPVGGKFAIAHLWRGWLIWGFWGWAVRQLADIKYFLSIFPPHKTIKLYWDEFTVFTKND